MNYFAMKASKLRRRPLILLHNPPLPIRKETSEAVMRELFLDLGVTGGADLIAFPTEGVWKRERITFIGSDLTETIMKWPETKSFKITAPFREVKMTGEVICRRSDGSPVISVDGASLQFGFDPFALHLSNLCEGFKTWKMSTVRNLALSFYWSVPNPVRKGMRLVARKLKAPKIRSVDDLRLLGVSSNVVVKLVEENMKRCGAIKSKKGPTAAILSHDVDTDFCQCEGRERLSSVESDEKVTGVWFFVPKSVQYTLNENAVRELYEKGHEIGMHGLTHDGKLRLDNQQELVKQLESGKRVFNDLGADVVSFRSPWALRSSILHSALHQAGFQVDSSYPDIDTLGTTGGRNGIEYNRPYRPFHRTTTGFAVTQIWEIPSTGPQDVQIIEDISASQDQVLEIWKRKAEFCQDFGGVFTHHSHPIHVIKHLEAYAKIIRHLKQNGFEITSMRTIAASKQPSLQEQVE